MYPHDKKVAEYVGATVVRTSERIRLRNEWGTLGALTANVLKGPQWVLRRGTASVATQNGADLDLASPVPGDYTLTYSFRDFKDRAFSATIPLRVLAPADFTKTIGAAVTQAALY